MATAPTAQTPRRFSRITFHRPAVLDLKVARAECEVLDISLKGALVQVGPQLKIKAGDPCALIVQLDVGDAQIRMDGEVAHVHAGLAGIKSDEMDLDSMSHLRRLVEVNLGDEDVLHRELAALVSERDF